MALNIKDAETERLAAKVAELTGESKTGAVRAALRAELVRIEADRSRDKRRERLHRWLEDEVWPLIPEEVRGRPVTKAERDELLDMGPEGV